jgi:hypothetical protein
MFSGAMNQFSDVAERRLIVSIRAVQERKFVAADPIVALRKVIQQRQGLVRTKLNGCFFAHHPWRAKQSQMGTHSPSLAQPFRPERGTHNQHRQERCFHGVKRPFWIQKTRPG